MKAATASAIASVLLVVGDAGAVTYCKRWNVPLTQCEVLPQTCTNNIPSPLNTDKEKAPYYAAIYVGDSQTACNNWAQYGHPNVSGTPTVVVLDQVQVKCFIDQNGNGQHEAVEFHVNISLQSTPREPCCDDEVVGPHNTIYPDVSYTGNQWSGPVYTHYPKNGASFTHLTLYRGSTTYYSQISLVRAQNQALDKFGQPIEDLYLSDLMRPKVPKFLSDLEKSYCPNGYLDNDPFILAWECKPQVDHMVPRVDIKGCPCGSNSYSNALLISAKLNNEMKNYCDHPARVAIRDHYRVQTASIPRSEAPRHASFGTAPLDRSARSPLVTPL